MRTTLVGAGSVGLWLAVCLERAGFPTRIVTRTREAATRIAGEGIRGEDLSSSQTWVGRPQACALEDLPAGGLERGPVLLCVRSNHTESAGRALSSSASLDAIVSMQNGIGNEAILAGMFSEVIGGIFRSTATRVAVTRVRGLAGGRIVLGRHPHGIGNGVVALAQRFSAAGFDVGLSERIGADKWLKLCVNLMSAPNALVRREDHTTAAFVAVKVALLEEARACLRAAGIEAASGDGRDRSLEEEITHQRSALERGSSARALPLYNHVWTALRDGSPLESDLFHERIVELAERNGVAAPVNRRVLSMLRRAAEQRRGPECVAATDLL